jgi:hypothetical protein
MMADLRVNSEEQVSRPPAPGSIYTRIELCSRQDGRVDVEKWEQGWTASTYPKRSIQDELTLEEMRDWLKEHGWIVIEWRDWYGRHCVRAWLGERLPVRTRETIKWMRQEITNGRLKIKNAHAYDLAFWF